MRKTPKDRALFEKLYQKNAKKLYFVARRIVQNEEMAEEAMWRGFQNLTENWEQCSKLDYENLERLATILVKNAAAKMTDRHNVKTGQTKVTDWQKTGKLAELEEENTLTQAVRQLSEDERNLLFMQHVLQFGPKEIGSLLDMNPKEAKKKLADCNEKIRTVMEEMSA